MKCEIKRQKEVKNIKMDYIYSVPIIPHNLNKRDTIIQIAEVLNHLSKVTDDIMKHITVKMENSNKKMMDISSRISEVNKKTKRLSGARRATQVFSSSKYPAIDINARYTSIFSDVKPIDLERHKVKDKKASMATAASNEELVNKLQIYHVKVRQNEQKRTIVGLGEIPHDIKCINDLLLYNSGKNLYKNFIMSDALQVSHQVKEQEVVDNAVFRSGGGIGSAPHSIRERSTFTKSSAKDYFYSPNLGQVPALDVPLDLPDLPGIADDLRFDLELDQGIAPSVITTPNIPELPTITEMIPHDTEESLEEAHLPSPPPLNASIKPTILVDDNTQQADQTINKIEEIPPQAPPLDHLSNHDQVPHVPDVSEINQENNKQTSQVSVPQLSSRADLMEAIRKAGGSKNAKLKSTTTTKTESASTIGGGDLMADLHAKLAMRRKGISGAKNQQQNSFDVGSALEKISAMIPPPTKVEVTDNITEDEDWDD